MIATGAYEVEFADDDAARELEALALYDVDGFELETAARPGLEEETTDDEIGRACEELQLDEG